MQEERRFHHTGLVPGYQRVLMGSFPLAEGILKVWRHEEGPLQLRVAGATPGVAGTAPARAGSAGIRFICLPQILLSLPPCLLPS